MTHFQLGNSCFRTPQATSAEAVELQTRHFRGRCSRYQSLCFLHYILDHSSISIQNCFLPWKQESCWFWTNLSFSILLNITSSDFCIHIKQICPPDCKSTANSNEQLELFLFVNQTPWISLQIMQLCFLSESSVHFVFLSLNFAVKFLFVPSFHSSFD